MTSIVSAPISTCTIWKRRPMMRERRKQWRTCSGVALVATSKSFGLMPGQQIAYRAADDVGLEALLLKRFDGTQAAAAERRGGYRVCWRRRPWRRRSWPGALRPKTREMNLRIIAGVCWGVLVV